MPLAVLEAKPDQAVRPVLVLKVVLAGQLVPVVLVGPPGSVVLAARLESVVLLVLVVRPELVVKLEPVVLVARLALEVQRERVA